MVAVAEKIEHTPELLKKCLDLYAKVNSVSKVSKAFGVPEGVLRLWIKTGVLGLSPAKKIHILSKSSKIGTDMASVFFKVPPEAIRFWINYGINDFEADNPESSAVFKKEAKELGLTEEDIEKYGGMKYTFPYNDEFKKAVLDLAVQIGHTERAAMYANVSMTTLKNWGFLNGVDISTIKAIEPSVEAPKEKPVKPVKTSVQKKEKTVTIQNPPPLDKKVRLSPVNITTPKKPKKIKKAKSTNKKTASNEPKALVDMTPEELHAENKKWIDLNSTNKRKIEELQADYKAYSPDAKKVIELEQELDFLKITLTEKQDLRGYLRNTLKTKVSTK